MSVQVNTLGNCCGFNVIFGFHDSTWSPGPPSPFQKQIDIEAFKCLVIARRNLTASLFVAITEEQNKWYGDAIKEQGFQLLSNNYRNPNTGARLYLYERCQYKWEA